MMFSTSLCQEDAVGILPCFPFPNSIDSLCNTLNKAALPFWTESAKGQQLVGPLWAPACLKGATHSPRGQSMGNGVSGKQSKIKGGPTPIASQGQPQHSLSLGSSSTNMPQIFSDRTWHLFFDHLSPLWHGCKIVGIGSSCHLSPAETAHVAGNSSLGGTLILRLFV